MGLGQITKQLAKEAIGNQVKDVFEGLDAPAPEKPAAPETVGATILRQVQAMQGALKPDEELLVLFHNGFETLRVMDFFVPAPQVIVMVGTDAEKNVTRVISPADSLQLTCKVVKAQPGVKPVPVRFINPKPAPK